MATTASLIELERTADGLRSVAAELHDTASPDGVDLDALSSAARTVQRLTESVITEVVALSQRDGTSTPPDTFLSGDGTVARGQVQAEIDRARVAEAFPSVADRHRAGAAHTGNLDVLARTTRTMAPKEIEAMATHDEAIADAATRLSEESFRKRVTRLRDKIRQDGGTTAAQRAVDDSFARIGPSKDRSTYRLTAGLDPIRGASVKSALAREAKYLTEHPELCAGTTPEQISAQALHDLILRGDSVDRVSVPRASVQILVLSDRDTLEHGPHENTIAENFDGLPIPAPSLGRLCCEATMRRVDTAADAEVNASRAARSPSEAQRAALRALYPCCPISGAGWESIEIHHVIFFSESKRTVLSELVPVSRRWHSLIHDKGWQLTMDADRTLHLSRPDGTPFRTIAPPTPVNRHDHDLAA